MSSLSTTRLAPSPTGALHLGNARTFLINWALARQDGWRVVMRIEDLDTPRVKPGAEAQCLDVLAWLGLTWDWPVTRQSDDLTPYTDAMRALASEGMAYPCDLTRSQIEAAASAPQEGTLDTPLAPQRPRCPVPFDDPARNWRFATPRGSVAFDDACAGSQSHDPSQEAGDFVVWTKRGQPAYQLAVIVDDARQGITHVVRGDDLLPSTARQLAIAHALDLDWSPTFIHLPLVRGEDGRRLAKRHGDTRIDTYRERGVRPERIIALLAKWSGVPDPPERMTAKAFADAFDLSRLPREPVRFTQEDDAWLLD
ncbi:MAG: glutamate--tRNA ligase family protein [Planctomycetota bacterium]